MKWHIIGLLIMSLVMQGALAEENNTTEYEPSPEMEIVHGAEMRLLQLERALERNIETGRHVIANIQEEYPDADVSGLEDILTQMDDILLRVQHELDELSEDFEMREFVERFTALRQLASEKTTEFRRLTHSIVSEERREAIRERVRDIQSEREQMLQERIREARARYNAEAVRGALSRAGVDDEALVAQIRQGQLRAQQAREMVQTRLQERTRPQTNEEQRERDLERERLQQEREERLQQEREELLQEREERLQQEREELLQEREEQLRSEESETGREDSNNERDLESRESDETPSRDNESEQNTEITRDEVTR